MWRRWMEIVVHHSYKHHRFIYIELWNLLEYQQKAGYLGTLGYPRILLEAHCYLFCHKLSLYTLNTLVFICVSCDNYQPGITCFPWGTQYQLRRHFIRTACSCAVHPLLHHSRPWLASVAPRQWRERVSHSSVPESTGQVCSLKLPAMDGCGVSGYELTVTVCFMLYLTIIIIIRVKCLSASVVLYGIVRFMWYYQKANKTG